MQKVKVLDNGCWEWQGGTFREGYALFRYQGRMQNAHRVIWIAFNGPVAKGMCVSQRCRNRRCVNLQHLALIHRSMVSKESARHDKGDCAAQKRRLQIPPIDREWFYARVDVRKEDECWEWTKAKNAGGYGVFRMDGVTYLAHRTAWVLENGPIRDRMCVLHNCPGGDNRPCCNVRHLRVDTYGENNADRARKGRNGYNGKCGETNAMAKLTNAQAHHIQVLKLCGWYRPKDLAAMYLVSVGTIRNIWNGKTKFAGLDNAPSTES